MKKIKSNGSSKLNHVLVYILELVDIYVSKRVSKSAAALSYFLTLSLFPVLICVQAMLAYFSADLSTILKDLEMLIPQSTLIAISDYLAYVSKQDSAAIFTAGIIATATTSAAAFRTIHRIMAEIQGKQRFSGIGGLIFSFLFSLLFLAAMYFALVAMAAGKWLFDLLEGYFPALEKMGFVTWLRYPLLFIIFVFVVYGLYKLTAPKGYKKHFFPGAIAASAIIMIVSIIFSMFISISSKYPLVYGSLASVIIYMVWMYICCQILIMGNALNVVIRRHVKTKGNPPEINY